MSRNGPDERDEPRLDVVIVGAGMAGLTAAHRLREKRIAVLEADDRVGGRVMSRPDGGLWLNWGAHMLGGPDTHVGRLIAEFGLPVRPIGGRLIGLIDGERKLLGAPTALYPFAMSLTLRERVSLSRMGLALRRGAARFTAHAARSDDDGEAARRERMRRFEAERTLSKHIGPLAPRVGEILRSLTERTGADPEEMAAGHGLRSFANVWAKSAPGMNLVGGSSRLPEAIAASLGPLVRTAWRTIAVRRVDEGIDVYCESPDGARTLRAKHVVLAVPGGVAAPLLADHWPQLSQALSAQRCGPFLSAAVRIRAPAPAPLPKNYAVATPGRSFSVIVNMATALPEGERDGGALMLFRGARGAARLMQEDDAAIARTFRADLEALFPQIAGRTDDLVVRRWPCGAPYLTPGAWRSQAPLDRLHHGLILAGDHLEAPNLEAAVRSGEHAAAVLTRAAEMRDG